MQFETRSKETVLADLKQKLRGLPANHPDHEVLARMIQDLAAETKVAPSLAVAKDEKATTNSE
jgi:hypothetical protein